MCRTILVDEAELERFVEWLPGIAPHQAYLVQLMIRTRGVKEVAGFKGGEHAVEHTIVPGYHEYWRLLLRLKVRRLALLAGNSDTVYAYFHHEPKTRRVDRIVMIPPQVMALYIQVNPCKWVTATIDAAREVMERLREATLMVLRLAYEEERLAARELYGKVLHHMLRADAMFYSNCARRVETRFHVVDLDDRSYHDEVLGIIQDVLGYKPAIIWTARGAHYLVPIWRMSKEQLKAWFLGLRGDKGSPASKLAELAKQLRDEEGRPLLEVKKQALEPVPGTLYKGQTVVRFEPEEG